MKYKTARTMKVATIMKKKPNKNNQGEVEERTIKTKISTRSTIMVTKVTKTTNENLKTPTETEIKETYYEK